MRKHRTFVLGATALAFGLLLGACGSGGDDNPGSTSSNKGDITVGVSGAFTENQLVAEMYAQVLEKAGYTVTRSLDLGSREISDKGLFAGDIDIKPEYIASELFQLDPEAQPSSDAQENIDQLKPLYEEHQVEVLEPSEVNDVNTWVVTKETADANGLTTVSDLQAVAGDLVLGGPPECPDRQFCLKGLGEVYGIHFKEFKPLDVGGSLTVEALKGGEIDVALLFSTDPVIPTNGWVALEDDKHLQLADNITPVARDDALNSEIEDLLGGVSGKLTTENITDLIGKVNLDNEDIADVARAFLTDNGLL